ncbi:helix-turn-helix domain-containing protein [Amycolatopsis antarctica]|nr:RNA-binding domain-containing protein [Amycolatopsis antarctica]
MTDDALRRLINFSNLRARVKLYNLGEGNPGSWDSNDFGLVRGVDVRLEDFANLSFVDLHSFVQGEFALPERECVVFGFHFYNGKIYENFGALFYRSGDITLNFNLSGGNFRSLEYARSHVEQVFISAGATVESLEHMEADEEVDEDYWSVTLAVSDFSVLVGAVGEAMKATRSALCTFRGELGPDRFVETRQSILNGEFSNLLGAKECDWLECKSTLSLGSREGNEMLVKSVCGFANGFRSSLLVVGVRTRPLNGSDTVAEVTPVSSRVHTVDRYQKIIDDYVSPAIRGMKIDAVPVDDGVVVVVMIPAQPEHEKLFVVTTSNGAGSTKTKVQSVYQRRGDRTVQLSTADMHALLSAGYQKLRSEQ